MDKKVQMWLEKNIIDEEIALKIDTEIKAEKDKFRKIRENITVYTVAAVLIGTGVISFIAANDWILKLFQNVKILKTLLMIVLSCSSLYGGYVLTYEKKNYTKLGTFLIVLSSFLIGGTYAVTGQSYNINSGSSLIYLLWLLSIFPLACIFKNGFINFMSVVLFTVFVILKYVELDIDNGETWTIFFPVFIGLIFYLFGNIPVILDKFDGFSQLYKRVGLIAVYITLLILICSVEPSYELSSLYYTVPTGCLIVWNIVNYLFAENKKDALIITETIFAAFLSSSLLALLMIDEVNKTVVMTGAHLALIALVGFGFYYGYKGEKEKIVDLSNKMLTIYLVVTYCRWGWSYMDKTAFFLIGGFFLLFFGIYLEHKRKKLFSSVNNPAQIEEENV